MLPARLILRAATGKDLDRTGEDLERAAARHGLQVVSIHDLVPGMDGCRLYEICHEPSARAAAALMPEAAVLVPCRVLLTREEGRTSLAALRPDVLLEDLEDFEEIALDLSEVVMKIVAEAAR